MHDLDCGLTTLPNAIARVRCRHCRAERDSNPPDALHYVGCKSLYMDQGEYIRLNAKHDEISLLHAVHAVCQKATIAAPIIKRVEPAARAVFAPLAMYNIPVGDGDNVNVTLLMEVTGLGVVLVGTTLNVLWRLHDS